MLGAFAVILIIATVGRKLGCGEGDAAEHLTGIFCTAGGIAALLGGNGVIQYRYDELCRPLQTNDGELSQRDEEPTAVTAVNQIVIKQAFDALGNLQGAILPAAVITNVLYLGAENHGIQHLHHSSGKIGGEPGDSVGFIQPCVAAVDVGMAFFTAEHGPFGEHRKAVQGGGTSGADGSICKNPVVEADIDAVVIPIKGHRLDGGLLRLENFRRRFLRFRHYLRCYRPRLQS